MRLFWAPVSSTVLRKIFCYMVWLLWTAMPSAGFEVVSSDVVGVVGEDLVLPCLLQSSTSAVDMEVIWTIEGKIVHHYKNHQDQQDQQLPHYRGRTSLSREELQRGNASLKLASVTHLDADVYMCKIISKTETKEARVSVKVKSFEVVGVSVIGVVGEDLILPCSLKPSTSAEGEEVIWLIGKDIVHHHKRHQDWSDQQLPAYRGRTSLFKDELARGNLSLKITSVNQSDANTYRCFISPENGGPVEASVLVTVETVGSTPVISAVSLGNGNASLECQSEGWSDIPQLEWLDSKGHFLLAEPPCVQSLAEGLRVKSTITVEERNGNIIHCRVRSSAQNRETKFEVACHRTDAIRCVSLCHSNLHRNQPHLLHNERYKDWIIAILVVIIFFLLLYILKKHEWCGKGKCESFEKQLLKCNLFEGCFSRSFPDKIADDMTIQWCNGKARILVSGNGKEERGYEGPVTVNNQPLQEGQVTLRLRKSSGYPSQSSTTSGDDTIIQLCNGKEQKDDESILSLNNQPLLEEQVTSASPSKDDSSNQEPQPLLP